MFANIIVDITHEKLDKIFQYRVPSHMEGELSIGMEVLVPFGKGNRMTKGYVVDFSKTAIMICQRLRKLPRFQEKAWQLKESWSHWQPG